MKNPKRSSWGSLPRLKERLHRSSAELPRSRRINVLDRLFGEMTHFCFVVELGDKGARKRSLS